MKYNNVIFLGLCLGLTTYSALSADSVIKSTSGFKRNLWTNREQSFSRNRPVSHWCHFYL